MRSGFIDLLTSALVCEWSASRFNPGERASFTRWIGGWMDPRAGLEDVEKRKLLTLLALELRPVGRPALSQSLYRLLKLLLQLLKSHVVIIRTHTCTYRALKGYPSTKFFIL
jgi:hypothetical protein